MVTDGVISYLSLCWITGVEISVCSMIKDLRVLMNLGLELSILKWSESAKACPLLLE